jgi:hypothetical protein
MMGVFGCASISRPTIKRLAEFPFIALAYPNEGELMLFTTLLQLELLEDRNLLTSSLGFVPSPVINGSGLNAAAAIAANDIWAVGGVLTSTGAHTTLGEHFNGSSWNVVPTPAVNDPLVAVAGSASNDVWALGSQVNIAESPTPFIAHWNGTSWSIVNSPKLPKDSFLTGVTAPASNNAWVVGNTFSSPSGIIEHWDGMRWSIVSSPAFTNVVAFAIAADSSTDVWAFGLSNATGAPEALHFDGTTWTAVPAATSRFGFEAGGLAVLSPTNVWAVGASATGEPLDTLRPAAQHWDGTSWSFVPVPNPDQGTRFRTFLSGVAAISANDIWAVGRDSSGTLTEHWDGTSWSIISSPDPGKLGNSLSGVTALSDGTVAAVGEQLTLKTTTGLILQNAASAPPKKAAAAVTAPFTLAGNTNTPLGPSVIPAGTSTADQTRTLPAFLHDGAPADSLLAADGMSLHSLSFIGHSLATHPTATIWDFSPTENRLFDWV